MAKAKKTAAAAKKKKAGKVVRALVGGNLADGTRFEAGEDVTNIPAEDLAALEKMGAVAEDA